MARKHDTAEPATLRAAQTSTTGEARHGLVLLARRLVSGERPGRRPRRRRPGPALVTGTASVWTLVEQWETMMEHWRTVEPHRKKRKKKRKK